MRPAREQTKRGFSDSFPSPLRYLFNGIRPWPSCVRGCDKHLVFLGFRRGGSRGFAPEGQLLLRWVQFPPSTYPSSFFLYFPNPAQFLLHSQQFLRSLGP